MDYAPKVSIGIPVYNVSRYIERCARSLFEQTYNNIQYVFVNDASTDNSIEILNKICLEYPGREIVVENLCNNSGLSNVRNVAISKMTGEFVLWVDSDDWVEDNLVEHVVQKQLETGADMVLFNTMCHYSDSKTSFRCQPVQINSCHSYTLSVIKKTVPHELWGRLIRLEIYLNNGIECISGANIGEDYQVTTRLAYYSNRIVSLQDVLYHYNCSNPGSLTKNGSVEQSWLSVDSVFDFFASKGGDFYEAVTYAVLWSVSCDFVSYGKYGNPRLYCEAKKRLSLIPPRFWRLLSISRRWVLFLNNCPMLLLLSVKFASRIKYIHNRITK